MGNLSRSPIAMNMWIGKRQSQGQANCFVCDVSNRSKLPRVRYNYITSCLFLCKRANNSALVFIQLTELFTVAMKFIAIPMKLVYFDDVRTSWDCLLGQSCTADCMLIHIIDINDIAIIEFPASKYWLKQRDLLLRYMSHCLDNQSNRILRQRFYSPQGSQAVDKVKEEFYAVP